MSQASPPVSRHTIADLWRFHSHPDVAAERERVRGFPLKADQHLNQRREGLGKTTYRARRDAERRLADRFDELAAERADIDGHVFSKLAGKLRACRLCGQYGYDPESDDPDKVVIAWEEKCGCARLCPDEARVEQQRLVRRYKPAVVEWASKSRLRRVQKGVLTWPNVARGDLGRMKREQMKRFAKLLDDFPVVSGALVSQEDPLSRHGDWNLHLNVVLLIDGRFDWSEFRTRWTALGKEFFPDCPWLFQVEMRELSRGLRELEDEIAEVIKYPVKQVASTRAGEDGAEFAPALVDWTDDAIVEWYNAGLRFRRTRSYRALFKVKDADEERLGEQIVWIGRVEWSLEHRVYVCFRPSVDLIPGDNFSEARQFLTDNLRTGPPRSRFGPEVVPTVYL